MTLPNFLIVGAMKAGTTWLSFNLEQHPQVFIPKKELHYFNNEKNIARGQQWYESKFSAAGDAIAIGEKTPGYLLSETATYLIHKVLPEAKILIVLRNPVTRCISQINHHIRYGSIPPDLDSNHFVGTEVFKGIDQEYAIIERGKYLEQIRRYHTLFGVERVLVLINEIDIRLRSSQTLHLVCDFLGVDTGFEFPIQDKKIHENKNSKLGTALAYRNPLIRPLVAKVDRYIPGTKALPFEPSDSEIRKLYSIYEEDNQKLFDYLGFEFPISWKNT